MITKDFQKYHNLAKFTETAHLIYTQNVFMLSFLHLFMKVKRQELYASFKNRKQESYNEIFVEELVTEQIEIRISRLQ